MEKMYRDFTVCETCGESCYLGNRFCEDCANELYADKCKKADQYKISFAVEQLEQLKHDIWTDQQDDGWLDEQVDIYFLTETIDNQIKQLTHQHEDKGE